MMKTGFMSAMQYLRIKRTGWNNLLNPAWDQFHRSTRVPQFSVISVLGTGSESNFVAKALQQHDVYSDQVFGQTGVELIDFANQVAEPSSWGKKSGYILTSFPANLEQAQAYEDITDGLNLVITHEGDNSELAEYYRSRGVLLEFKYDGERSEGANLERFHNELACTIKH